ncbi:uncharacterized protein ACJ7VT_003706 [Polymixia lowei]
MPRPPGFDFIDKVELYVRTATYPPQTTRVAKQVIRATSKQFVYKDECLWRSYRGRILRVVRSNEEVREILTRYHDNNGHAGQRRMMRQILSLYYWARVTQAVKDWVKNCPDCQQRTTEPHIQQCLAYGCETTSWVEQDVTFHRFPKEAERRKKWLSVAQRDQGSLRPNSCLCSKHFERSCYEVDQEGQTTLRPDADPTITTSTLQEEEVPVPEDHSFLYDGTAMEVLITASAATDTTEPLEPLEPPTEFTQSSAEHVDLPVEHQYCLSPPDTDSRTFQKGREGGTRKCSTEPCFVIYDQIVRYLSHRILPLHCKKSRYSVKRMAKRFKLTDGVLMYTRFSPPVKVPRSREEVNSILLQFHDNQGHYCLGICQRAIIKHYYWSSMSRDLAHWISNCNTCLNRTKRKWLRCSVYKCTNCCGPVERGLGLTFHKFPVHNPGLLAQWLENLGRPSWHPSLGSSVCSAHFTEDCFDRSGEKVTLRPGAVPSLFLYSDPFTQTRTPTQPAVVEEVTTQDQAFFAKYNAVELYLRSAVYPPHLTYVEKNTFRRFCKNFTIKDDQLHMVRGGRVRVVLRSREEVEGALVDYHDELNHLDLKKCLRLLNDRFFWKTMKADVVRWIDSCSQCSRAKTPETQTEPEPAANKRSHRSPVQPENQKTGLQLQSGPQTQTQTKHPSPPGTQRLLKRKRHPETGCPAKRGSRCVVEPVVSGSVQTQAGKPAPERDSSQAPVPPVSSVLASPSLRPGRLQARTVVQRCSQAKVQVKPAMDGAEAQWAEIQEGMVVYVCFFNGANKDVIQKMANTLLNTKLFRNAAKQPCSVLELPGSVLLVPQDSLLGELVPRRRVQYRGACQPWWGAQLYARLVSTCRKVVAGSARCSTAGVTVEHGIYGQEQEILLRSSEPLTHLLEF